MSSGLFIPEIHFFGKGLNFFYLQKGLKNKSDDTQTHISHLCYKFHWLQAEVKLKCRKSFNKYSKDISKPFLKNQFFFCEIVLVTSCMVYGEILHVPSTGRH